jgi:hypothetical protein
MFSLLDCRLEFNTNLEDTANGHVDTGFLGSPLHSGKYWDGFQVPNCYCMFGIKHSQFKFTTINPLVWNFKIKLLPYIIFFSINRNHSSTVLILSHHCHHSNVFIFNFIQFITDRRGGKKPGHLLKRKCLSHLPCFSFFAAVCYILHLSLL